MARVRHHVNPLGRPFRQGKPEPLVLPEGMPVEVELGCADARFLFELAPKHPETFYVGMEIRQPLVDEVNDKARGLGLANLLAYYANINVELDELVPDGRFKRVFVNFPDPWFKRRHHKRRLMTIELVEVIHRKLASDGELFFQSDVWDLAIDAMEVVESQDGERLFENVAGAWTFLKDNPFGAKSLREVRCEERAMPIWRILYRPRRA